MKETVGPIESDLGRTVISAIKKERADSLPSKGEVRCLKLEICEQGQERSVDSFPGGMWTFLSLSCLIQFS